MRLFLHAGLNKTGSSYLQSTLAKNRAFLEKNGVYFPIAGKREGDMLKGRVSPGNALELYESLKAGDDRRVSRILERQSGEANKKGLSNLLLSNERLFTVFSNKEKLRTFYSIATDAGITQIAVLLILRDPVEHALSLYKHKGKFGNVSSFEDWIGRKYETVGLLEQLLEHYVSCPIEWTFRKYSSDSNHLLELFFGDWLQIALPQDRPFDKVNPSLNLAEILFLSGVRKYNPSLTEPIYRELITLSNEDKANNRGLEAYYRSIASSCLQRYGGLFDRISALLPVNERLSLPKADSTTLNSHEISLTNVQIERISRGLKKHSCILDLLKNLVKRKL